VLMFLSIFFAKAEKMAIIMALITFGKVSRNICRISLSIVSFSFSFRKDALKSARAYTIGHD